MRMRDRIVLAAAACAWLASALPAAAGGASLTEALAVVRPERIRSDLEYVASDEMAGRDTPSPGQRLTARFLRNRLERLGFAPGARDGFFHRYPLEAKRVDVAATGAWIEHEGQRHELALGKDFFLSTRSLAALELEAPVVHVGSGSKEDVAEAGALAGKFVLAVDRGDFGRRIDDALAGSGALGVLMMQGERTRGFVYEEFFPGQMDALRDGAPGWPDGDESPRLPRIYLPKASAAKLLAGMGEGTPRIGAELAAAFGAKVVLLGDGRIDAENVCGWWPGSDPLLLQEAILVSAHYDHLGTRRDGEVMNGADDNGSGTTGLLALAEALAARGPLRRSVLLIWVSGEEKGLWGSRAWSDAPWLPDGARPVADINIDMIGRNAPDQLLVTPTARHAAHNGLVRLAERLAPQEGFTRLGSADAYYTRSDHAMFARLGIPVTFLFADVHDDYHKSSDDVEKIDFDKIARVVRVIVRMLDEMQGPALLPAE